MSVSSEFVSELCFSASDISSKETSPSSVFSSAASTLDSADPFNSSRSSFETFIFSGIFLALFEGRIGVPLFEISPLYKF